MNASFDKIISRAAKNQKSLFKFPTFPMYGGRFFSDDQNLCIFRMAFKVFPKNVAIFGVFDFKWFPSTWKCLLSLLYLPFFFGGSYLKLFKWHLQTFLFSQSFFTDPCVVPARFSFTFTFCSYNLRKNDFIV